MTNKKPKKRAASNRVFDSMAQAASTLGTPKEVLQELKAAGCPAFRGGRVHEAELMGWVRQRQPASPLADEEDFLRRVHNLSCAQAGLICFVRVKDPDGTRWPGADPLLAGPVLDAVDKLFKIGGRIIEGDEE